MAQSELTGTNENSSGYKLSRRLFEFAFENRQCNVYHIALYSWIVELNNRLAWKKQFGLPTADAMECLSIGNKRTYLSALRDLAGWGFINIISEAKNQYQSCVIELCHSNNATALPQHDTQHSPSTVTGSAPIDKPLNKETLKRKSVTLPILNDVFSFFKEATKGKEWTDEFCKLKAEKFIENYKDNWPLDWQAKVRTWIVTERDTNSKSKVTAKTFPDFYNKKIMEELATPALQKQYREHLNSVGLFYMGYDHLGDSIWCSKDEQLEAGQSVGVINQLASKFSLMPESTIPKITHFKTDPAA